jgi:hypothetical protein
VDPASSMALATMSQLRISVDISNQVLTRK